MSRSLALVALAFLLVGCTRFGTNPAGGPFARKSKTLPDPYSANPSGPPATSSPLALTSPNTPSNEGIPAGGVVDGPGRQILPRRRPNPKSGPMPPQPKDQPMPGAVAPTVGGTAANQLAEVKKLVAAATEKWKT